MKSWQQGIELSKINEVKEIFKDYNSKLVSPFSQWGGPKIAKSLSQGRLIKLSSGTAYIDTHIAKTSTNIKMFPDVIIGRKLKGDRVVNAFCGDYSNGIDVAELMGYFNGFQEPTWIFINEEDVQQKAIVNSVGYNKVGTKFNTFGELHGVYFKDASGNRKHPFVDPSENVCMKQLNVPDLQCIISTFLSKLEGYNNFSNHPSKTNKYNSWGALSIRGYSSSISDIGKPSVGKKEWASNQSGQLQNTELYETFSEEIEQILECIPSNHIDRIRIMKLTPGGEIARHSDQIEKTAGFSDGKLCRIHVPIQTDDNVLFHMWNSHGKRETVHMPVGSMFIFDYRKPHAVTHTGTVDRLHIVLDVECNDKLRELING